VTQAADGLAIKRSELAKLLRDDAADGDAGDGAPVTAS
jgi:hypothetical protein